MNGAAAILIAALIYAVVGGAFAVAFLRRGIRTVDPGAVGAPAGFFILIFPGLVALWPVMLRRWAGARARTAGPASPEPPSPEPEHAA